MIFIISKILSTIEMSYKPMYQIHGVQDWVENLAELLTATPILVLPPTITFSHNDNLTVHCPHYSNYKSFLTIII